METNENSQIKNNLFHCHPVQKFDRAIVAKGKIDPQLEQKIGTHDWAKASGLAKLGW